MDVLSSEEKSSAFVEHDESKNAFGSFYHVREPATQRLHMTLSDFIDCLSSWKARKTFVRVRKMLQMLKMTVQANRCGILRLCLNQHIRGSTF